MVDEYKGVDDMNYEQNYYPQHPQPTTAPCLACLQYENQGTPMPLPPTANHYQTGGNYQTHHYHYETRGNENTALVMELLQKILPLWPKMQQEKVHEFIHKYGLPQEVGMGNVTWFNNGPWKRTTIYRQDVLHVSPTAHRDYVASTIDYRVPTEFFGALADFDGSLYPDRTAGEVTAKCDLEEMNFMALNIMHDMVTRKKTTNQALETAVEIEKAFRLRGERPLYTRGLQFTPGIQTADPGEQIF